MGRKSKTPNGTLFREVVGTIQTNFIDGEAVSFLSNLEDADETGRLFFEFDDGRTTKWYTYQSAPQWLKDYIDSVLKCA